MAFGKWSAGTLTWMKGEPLTAQDLNDSIAETTPPIGAIAAWVKSFSGVPSLPNGWVECNGQTLNDPESPLNGQVVPDLNGGNRFLRGSTSSGSTGGGTSHTHTITEDNQSPDSGSGRYYLTSTTTGSASNLPSYYDVVWIMRVK